jgi:hypothetical protein
VQRDEELEVAAPRGTRGRLVIGYGWYCW